MTIDEFLGKLQGVTSDGKGGWMACCPAHDDHNPSMHVNVGAVYGYMLGREAKR